MQYSSELFQPIVGVWDTTGSIGLTRVVFNSDGTCSEVNSLLGVSSAKNGTWVADSNMITRTWKDSSVDITYYSFSDKNSKMMMSKDSVGVSVTYTRQ